MILNVCETSLMSDQEDNNLGMHAKRVAIVRSVRLCGVQGRFGTWLREDSSKRCETVRTLSKQRVSDRVKFV
jgi:hypothetical protein